MRYTARIACDMRQTYCKMSRQVQQDQLLHALRSAGELCNCACVRAVQLVSEAELEALVTAFRTSLDAGSWPPLPLTAKLLQNALEGSHLPPAPSTEALTAGSAAAVQQNATNGTSAAANGHSAVPHSTAAASPGTAASCEGPLTQQSPEASAVSSPQQQTAEKLRQAALYQQLAVCLVVKLARQAVQAPSEQAFRQLAGFVPEPDSADTATAPPARPVQQQQQQQQQQLANDDATQKYVQRLQGIGAAPDTPDSQHPAASDGVPQTAEAPLAAEVHIWCHPRTSSCPSCYTRVQLAQGRKRSARPVAP